MKALAYIRARNADPLCSFGDFAAISSIVDACTALLIKPVVCDGIIAPGFEAEALRILKTKKRGAFIILQVNIKHSSRLTYSITHSIMYNKSYV